LSILKQTIASYPNLFKSSAGENEEGDGRGKKTFVQKWGWVTTIDNLSGRDLTKWDYFFDLPMTEFLNIVCYYIDREENDKKRDEQNRL
jgi:hypothetical protein